MPKPVDDILSVVAGSVFEAEEGSGQPSEIDQEAGDGIWLNLGAMIDADSIPRRYDFSHTVPHDSGEIMVYAEGVMPRLGEAVFPFSERVLATAGVRQEGVFAYKMMAYDGNVHEVLEKSYRERQVTVEDLQLVCQTLEHVRNSTRLGRHNSGRPE